VAELALMLWWSLLGDQTAQQCALHGHWSTPSSCSFLPSSALERKNQREWGSSLGNGLDSSLFPMDTLLFNVAPHQAPVQCPSQTPHGPSPQTMCLGPCLLGCLLLLWHHHPCLWHLLRWLRHLWVWPWW
jgi:hypothetical protein